MLTLLHVKLMASRSREYKNSIDNLSDATDRALSHSVRGIEILFPRRHFGGTKKSTLLRGIAINAFGCKIDRESFDFMKNLFDYPNKLSRNRSINNPL